MKTGKKVLSVLLSFIMLLSCCVIAFAEDAPTVVASGDCGADGDNLRWALWSDGTLNITGDGAMADYSVEAEVTDENGVTTHTTLSAPWFEAMEEYAFRAVFSALGYASAAELNAALDNGTLDTDAYFEIMMQQYPAYIAGVKALQKKVVIGEGVTTVGNCAFRDCEANELSLPSTLKVIGPWAFQYGKYTEVTLPEGLREIGSEAFSQAPLREITLPASVETIGDYPFQAYYLEKLTVLNPTLDVSGLRLLMGYNKEQGMPIASAGDLKTYRSLLNWFDYLSALQGIEYFARSNRSLGIPGWTEERETAFWEMRLLADLNVIYDLDVETPQEAKAALAEKINTELGTSFTADEMLGTPVPYYLCSDALLAAANAYDDALGETGVSEIAFFVNNYFSAAVSVLYGRDALIANEIATGKTAEEAAAQIDGEAAGLLERMNEKFDLGAADLAAAVPTALAKINETLGADFTLETAGRFYDKYLGAGPSAVLCAAIAEHFQPGLLFKDLTAAVVFCEYTPEDETEAVLPWLTFSGGCTAAVKDFAETAGIPYEPIHQWSNWHIEGAEINRPARRIRTCSVCQLTETEDISFDDCNWTPLPTSPDGLEDGAYYLDFTKFPDIAAEAELFRMYNSGEYFFDEEKLVFKETLTLPAAFSESGEDETITLTDFIENDGFEIMGFCLREAGAQWYPVKKTTEGLQDGDWYIDLSAADAAVRERLEGCDIYVNPNGKLEKYLVVSAELQELEYTGEFYPLMTKWMELVGPYMGGDDYTPDPYYAWPEVCPVQQYSDPDAWLPIATSTEGLADGDWYLDKEAYLDAYADGYTAYYVNEVNSDDYPGNDITPAEAAVMRDQLRADAAAQGDFFPVNPFIKPGGQPFEFKFDEVYVDPDTGDTVSYTLYLPRTDDAAGILYYQMFKAGVKQYITPEDTNWIDLPYTTDGLSDGDWYLDMDAFMDAIGRGKSDEEKAEVRELIEQHVVFSYNPGGNQYVYKYAYTDLPGEDGTPASGEIILPLDLTLGNADAFNDDYKALKNCVKQYHAPTTDEPEQSEEDESWFQKHIVGPLKSAIATILSFFRRLFGKKR